MKLPQPVELLNKWRHELSIARYQDIFIVARHCGLRPVEGPIKEKGRVYDDKFVVHVVHLLSTADGNAIPSQTINLAELRVDVTNFPEHV